MRRFREKLMRFMNGRYGGDELMYMLTVCYVVLMLVNVLLRSWTVHLLGLAVFAFAVYRFLSRNTLRRSEENRRALAAVDAAKQSFENAKSRAARRKAHYFKKCPHCGKTLRLPRVKGKHKTRCPSCGCEFSVRILRGKKS